MKFDEVRVGNELPQLVKGPLTPVHLMRWSAAVENWHRIHYDWRYAVEHDKLPDLLINGSLKQQFIMQALKDWAGHEGWVWKVSFQFRAKNLVGETVAVWGKVTGTRRAQDFGLVDLDLGLLNQAGAESTPGKAVIALPFASGPALPYPFKAPNLM
jgi:hydroxyacyl-ACP dehydratase HTD2-like protein with hotdog domain